MGTHPLILLATVTVLVAMATSINGAYQVGIGIADCTGPAAEITFMGYAKLEQRGCGIQLRLFSRAYIIDDGTKRVAFVTIDAQSFPFGLRRSVLQRLRDIYGPVYTETNVMLSGTHTHNGPGGFMMDLMLDVPNLGFVQESFDALLDGVTNSIINAHENLVETRIYLNQGEVLDANINRSPASYLQNPEEERARYEYDVDKTLTQLKFVRTSDDRPIGALNWFAVHPTSMNLTNCLVSSDNVGLASVLLEKYVNEGALPGQGLFVGAFASSNLGDVSPNTKGPICIDTGDQCDFVHSTCNGATQPCIAFGPGRDMVESTEIIATRIFEKARELFDADDSIEVTGPIGSIHQYVDMPNQQIEITLANGTTHTVRGCLPAMGYSFAGGTTDGPGDFDFTQGTLTGNPFWNAVRDLLSTPPDDQIECQSPKPILLYTGGITFPYDWQPKIVVTQILQVGQVALIGVPGEFTTMSGRRLREAVRAAIVANGGDENTTPILAGLSNVYTNYIATPEEYSLQRYEGGSTIYGPHTLDIYLQKYQELAGALIRGEELEEGPMPPDFSDDLLTLVGPAGVDPLPGGASGFGECTQQPADATIGDTVTAKFVSGNPRNNPRQGDTFLRVERLESDAWTLVATDAVWETVFKWERKDDGSSEVTVVWMIPEGTTPGTYRIVHDGNYKTDTQAAVPYRGISDTFEVA